MDPMPFVPRDENWLLDWCVGVRAHYFILIKLFHFDRCNSDIGIFIIIVFRSNWERRRFVASDMATMDP